MMDLLIPSLFEHVSLDQTYRVIRNVRVGPLTHLVKTYIVQEMQIRQQNKKGEVLPTVMHLEITTYCQRSCEGCYFPIEERRQKGFMSQETARKALEVGHSWNIRLYDLLGAEPISDETLPLIRTILKENPSTSFSCCTNAFRLSQRQRRLEKGLDDILDDIVRCDNINFGLSINGFKETNDKMRGDGAYDAVVSAAEYLRSERCLFGAVVTIWKRNCEEATSPEFIEFLKKQGCIYTLYSVSDELRYDEEQIGALRISLGGIKGFSMYLSSEGHLDGPDSKPNSRGRVRDIYVTKDGTIQPSRKQRTPIGQIDTATLEEVSKNPSWLERYNNQKH